MSLENAIVYVVDDDDSVREALELLIGCMDWQASTFRSAREFLSTARAEVPSCLVLDVSMPDMSGPELQRLLLTNGVFLPIIFITGHGELPEAAPTTSFGPVRS